MSGTTAYTERIAALAAERPDRTAIVIVRADGGERNFTWAVLGVGVECAARALTAAGVGSGDLVAVAIPKSEEHFFYTIGAWRIGARPLTLNPAMAAAERVALIDAAQPKAVVGTSEWAPTIVVAPGSGDIPEHDVELPPTPAAASFAIATGGSTGLPKIVLSPFPGSYDPKAVVEPDVIGRRRDMVQLVNGPLFHNSPCTLAYSGLLLGHTLVVMERFDPGLALDLIERHRVAFVPTVPTVMKRLIDQPGFASADLGSIETLFHTGAPCPPSVKGTWIKRLGGSRVYEAFGGSELVGTTVIRGDEWLQHRGSVGRPVASELLVLDERGDRCAPGVVGEIFMKPLGGRPRYRYLGTADRSRSHGDYESLGDLGHVDADGYLYIADRRTDLIITGGENVYPAEVEFAIIEHHLVRDVVVIGLPDATWGKRVYAIVEAASPAPSEDELREFCLTRLSAFKVPKEFELVAKVPRDEAGKVRRSQLVSERS